MRSSTEISTKCGFFIFLVMCLVAVLAQLLFAERASAGEEPAVERPVYLYILMNGRQSEIRHYRVKISHETDCEYALKKVRLGSHSRVTSFCSDNFEYAGDSFKFKKLMDLDERD